LDKLEEFEAKLQVALEKPDTELTDQDRSILLIERRRCGKSFLRFLGYCKIVEPPIPGQTDVGGIVPLILYPHIKGIVATFLTKRLISILKARQIGVSTIIAAYVLWYALFHIGANILLF